MSNSGGVYTFSKTAAANATADSTQNWQEGQAPSSINDSARSLLASIAKYRDDVSGSIVTTGISVAYVIATSQVFDTLAHMGGQEIAFTPHLTNGAGGVTVTIDTFANIPLRSSPGVELPAGVLIAGTPYVAIYNAADAALYLHGYYGSSVVAVPLASGMDYWGTTAPNSSFAFPIGQQISQTTYAALYALFGINRYGADGGGLFFLPDLRGRVTAALDNMGGSAAGRMSTTHFGANSGQPPTSLGNVGGLESNTLTTPQIPSHTHANTLTDNGHSHTYNGTIANQSASGSGNTMLGQAASTTSVNATGIVINNIAAGGGGAHANVQPTIVCNYIMRVI